MIITKVPLGLIILILLLENASCSFVRSHDFWFTGLKKYVKKGDTAALSNWMYCDLKCLYLEHYNPGVDFVYINFAQTGHPSFAACYVRKVTLTGLVSYSPWNTVTSNSFFNLYCGQETANYYALSQGIGPVYSVTSIKGIGIGNYPIY